MSKKKGSWKWIVAILMLLVVLPVLRYWLLDDWIKNKIEKQVHERSGGVYSLEIGDFRASFLSGNFAFDSLSLKPDYKKWEQQKKEKAPAMLADFKATQLNIKGLNILRLLFKMPLRIESIKLTNPNLMLSQMRQDTSKKAPLHEQLSGRLKDLQIQEVLVDSGYFAFREKQNSYYKAEVKQLQFSASDLQFDSTAYADTARVWYAGKMSAQLASSDFLMPEGFYRLKTGKAEASTNKQSVVLQQVNYVPLLSAAEMSERTGEAQTRVAMEIPEVQLKQLNYHALAKDGAILVGSMLLKQPALDAYKDKKHYQNKNERRLPHTLVQSFKKPLAIDKLVVQDMFIRYEELPPKAEKTGYITFNNFDVQITNISNIPERMSMKNPAVVDARTSIMGKADFRFNMQLALLDPECYHRVKGSIGEANLSIMNPILEPSAFVHIQTGHINKGNFEIELGCHKATGTMTVRYHNLDIEMLSDEKGERQGLVENIKTFAANKFVLKSENPDDGELRTGKIDINRRKKRSMFTYWKDCLMIGMLSSAGVPEKMQQKMQ